MGTIPQRGRQARPPGPVPGLGYAAGMKTYNIELQQITRMGNSHGLVNARVKADVQLQRASRDHDDAAGEAGTTLSMSIETARVLFLLLKAQLAEVDARKGRSQR